LLIGRPSSFSGLSSDEDAEPVQAVWDLCESSFGLGLRRFPGEVGGECELVEFGVLGEEDECLDQKEERWVEPDVLAMGKVSDERLKVVISLGDVDLAVFLVLPWNSSSDDSLPFRRSNAFFSDIFVEMNEE